MEYLELVDERDRSCGSMEKMKVHQLGLLHRAFSIFIFNSNGEMLLQKRSTKKYHSGGLWTNTCCGHPRFGEELSDSIARRLDEEMGMNCQLDFVFHFIYKAELDNNLVEHEYDHVFIGFTDDKPNANENEVDDWKYIRVSELLRDIESNPDTYTIWFKICLNRLIEQYEYFSNGDKQRMLETKL